MFNKTLLLICTFLVLRAAHCDDNDNSVEVCTTLNVPKYSTRCPENDDIVSNINERLIALEEKLNQKLDHVLTVLENITNRIMLDDGEVAAADESQPIYRVFHSCDDILKTYPDISSGLYNITNCDGHHHTVYCNMKNTCGDKEGGWMRVGYLNMSDPSEQCPPGFKLYEQNGVRACGAQSTPGCQSVQFPSNGIDYTQVCGRVTGYTKGSPDAIDTHFRSSYHNNINQAYVDGVSITRGNPRQHVWTFMASIQENSYERRGYNECPCAPNNAITPQSFIGNDYFCESGNPGRYDWTTFHTNDPLWNGKHCGLIEEACCNVPGIPWFNKVLQQPTTDYIELRACMDQDTSDEVSLVGEYEIYIK